MNSVYLALLDEFGRLNSYLNEIFGLFSAYTIIKIGRPENLVVGDVLELLEEQILQNNQLLHDLRYRSVTPYTLSVYLSLILKKEYPIAKE